ncbi:hypothetical protein F7725_012056 [Dissostichus mawsoni]|uniref:Uncharacterized protein n=1 Tax=Dissostichus mawsoni TaxID=36200 RepID=A0A7J5ZAP5_DISMA|nr:hypothetical protein F7725_012056 [Dissostichus mawsoni]
MSRELHGDSLSLSSPQVGVCPPGSGSDPQKTCCLRPQPLTLTWDSWPRKEVNTTTHTPELTSSSDMLMDFLTLCSGLGMYESPLFLAAHDEDGGGRSVPTTPLQVAAPVTVFTESLPSDSGDNMASQSVPMVTTSTGMASAADDGDEVFMEQEGEG